MGGIAKGFAQQTRAIDIGHPIGWTLSMQQHGGREGISQSDQRTGDSAPISTVQANRWTLGGMLGTDPAQS